MLDRLRAFVTGAAPSAPSCAQECAACPAEPGTVTPHAHHALVRLAPPGGAAAATADVWWPERVDDEPAIVAVTSALAARAPDITGKAKVTAFDYPAQGGQLAPPQAAGTCDVLLFPSCLHLSDVALESVGAMVASALAEDGAAAARADKRERLPGLTLLVCCHRSRDQRCGALGPPLAAALGALGARVYLTSHVGGHKWAGNVIAYGQGHAAHENWFGGLSARDAAAFLEDLAALQAGEQPAAHPRLRTWWRGRTGMSKEEQLALFQRCMPGDIEDVAVARS